MAAGLIAVMVIIQGYQKEYMTICIREASHAVSLSAASWPYRDSGASWGRRHVSDGKSTTKEDIISTITRSTTTEK
jgi:hypothetical protein